MDPLLCLNAIDITERAFYLVKGGQADVRGVVNRRLCLLNEKPYFCKPFEKNVLMWFSKVSVP